MWQLFGIFEEASARIHGTENLREKKLQKNFKTSTETSENLKKLQKKLHKT